MNRHLRQAVLAWGVRSKTAKAKQVRSFVEAAGVGDVVLVGCSPGSDANEMIVERRVAEQATELAAVDILPCPDLEWPFLQADGRDLPFPDGYTDLMLAQAVIEHVGDRDDQARFVAEQPRVGRSWVITTPNGWFPVESHTAVELLHWLLRWRQGRREFTRLPSLREFKGLIPAGTKVIGRPRSSTFLAFYPVGGDPWEQPPRLAAVRSRISGAKLPGRTSASPEYQGQQLMWGRS